MKYKQQFECWNCDLQYSFPLPQKEVASFIVEYPYCHSESTVDLAEIPKSKDILRNPGNNEDDHFSSGYSSGYIWPDRIKTKPGKT